jgi:hypothetical protein
MEFTFRSGLLLSLEVVVHFSENVSVAKTGVGSSPVNVQLIPAIEETMKSSQSSAIVSVILSKYRCETDGASVSWICLIDPLLKG